MNPFKKKSYDVEKIQLELDAALRLIKEYGEKAEGFFLTFHVVRDGRIHHHQIYQNFKNDDFGKCLIAIGCEAKRAEHLSTAKSTT